MARALLGIGGALIVGCLFIVWHWGAYLWFYRIALYPASVITITTKPVLLPSHEHSTGDSPEDVGHHVSSASPIFIAPRDLWIEGMDVSLMGAPTAVLHHVNLTRLDRTEPSCPNNYPARILWGSQDQMYDPHMMLPAGYALFIPKGTPLVLLAEFHNPEPPLGPGGTYPNVSVSVTLHLAYPTKNKPLTKVSMRTLFVEQHPCESGYQFDVPAHAGDFVIGPMSTSTEGRVTITQDSTLLYVGAHLHGWQGGTSLLLRRNGAVLATFNTTLSSTTPYVYNTPHYATEIKLKKGDVLSIEAHYRNLSPVTVRGAMAILGLYLTEPDTTTKAPYTLSEVRL